MKNFKRIASLVLALTMILCMGITAFAYTITITPATIAGTEDVDTREYKYDAYQIFAGALSDGKLSQITWGSNVDQKKKVNDLTLIDAIKAIKITANATEETPFKDCTDAASVAEVLKNYNDDTEAVKLFADVVADYITGTAKPSTYDSTNKKYSIDVGANAGYYLIQNNTVPEAGSNPGDLGEGSFTRYILAVLDNVTVAHKGEVPTIDKIITDDDYSTTEDIATDGKSDNVSVGSKVKYTITGTIPPEAANYDYYYYIVSDTLSPGLTLLNDDNNTITVTIGGKSAGEIKEENDEGDYYLYTGTDAGKYTFQIALANAKDHHGETVEVTYWAELNKDAVIGEVEGNPNTVILDYSRDPNTKYDGTQDKNKPGTPDSDKKVPMGQTPESITRTYTTGITLLKTNDTNAVLTGAEFTLTGTSAKKVITTGTKFIKSTEFDSEKNTLVGVDNVDDADVYYLLNDGTYTTTAPRTEDKYVVKTDNRDSGYVLDNGKYRVANEDELKDSSITLYKLLEANSDLYANTTDTYYWVKYEEVVEVKDNVTATAYVDEKGTVTFEGLGEGTYTIEETKVPAGYNKIENIVVTIDWTAPTASDPTKCDWSATSKGGVVTTTAQDVDKDTGMFVFTVVNKAGSTLPSTGGIGTTIFYIAGGVLLVGAAVLLITKRRMNING